MKKLTLLLLVTCLLFSLPLLAQQKGAKVYIDETVWNFGYTPGSSTITHSFYLFSRGTDSLKILRIKPG